MNKAKYRIIVTAGLIIFTLGILPGCENQAVWFTYTNKNYGYSIEYPHGWSVTEPFQNRQMVVIKSPDERDTISVLANDSKGLTLDQMVNNYVYLTQQGSYSYKLISDENVQIQGIAARELEIVFQSQKDSPVLTVRELYLINQRQFYLVRFSTRLTDLTSLSALYQHVFSSFKLIK